LPVSVFAFLGMAGVMSAAIEAPLMTIFIVMDLGQSYTYAAPIGICSIVSYLTVKGGLKLLGKEHNMVRHTHYLSKSDR
ncbi:MAG: chloride channel protein, partial [Muribaculaceae bacterium]|nr:chloride channel protein [Muribaculaceae bacterium]